MPWKTALLTATVLPTVMAALTLPAGCAEPEAGSGYDGPKEKLHVYLLLGGTNMCGRADFTAADMAAIPGCLLLNDDDRWEPARAPLNRYSSIMTLLGMHGLGPGDTFARTMRAGDSSAAVGLIVNAVVSKKETSVNEWLKGTECYNEAVRRAKTAQASGTLKGVLWLQGEKDTADAQYMDKLKALVSDLRNDLGDPKLPFVASQIPASLNGAAAFNERMAKLPESVPCSGVVSSEGVGTRGGTIWIQPDGMKLLGRRFAEGMLKIQDRPIPEAGKEPEPLANVPAADPAYSGPKEKLHIYILIGQSNMSGRAEYTREDAKIIDRCFLLNFDNQWEPARLPLNRYSSLNGSKSLDSERLSPGYGFVKAMLEKDPSVCIGLVSNARGSTFIAQWKSGFLKQLMPRVKVAQESGVVKGILWHQGESDNKNAGYLEELKAMIADYRKEIGDPNLPFVAGEILNNRGVGKLINDQLAQLPAQVPFTGVASAEGLTGTEHVLISTDNVHFDMESMKTLGRRYAEEMLKIQNGQQQQEKP